MTACIAYLVYVDLVLPGTSDQLGSFPIGCCILTEPAVVFDVEDIRFVRVTCDNQLHRLAMISDIVVPQSFRGLRNSNKHSPDLPRFIRRWVRTSL